MVLVCAEPMPGSANRTEKRTSLAEISIAQEVITKIHVVVCLNMKQKGFTVLETVIYLSILVILLTVFVNFIWEIAYGNLKLENIEEVQENSRFAMEKITRSIQGSLSINGLDASSSSNTLSLHVSDKKKDPVVFDVSGGRLRMTEKGSGPYYITNNRVEVQNINFTNVAYPNTTGAVRVEITVKSKDPQNNLSPYTLVSTVSLLEGGSDVSE